MTSRNSIGHEKIHGEALGMDDAGSAKQCVVSLAFFLTHLVHRRNVYLLLQRLLDQRHANSLLGSKNKVK